MPFFPKCRIPRPVTSRFHKSSGDGLSMPGGVIDAMWLNTPATFSSSLVNSTYFAPSFAEKCEIAPAVFAASS